MAKRRSSKEKEFNKDKQINFMDGWGLILLIIGLALLLLRQEMMVLGAIIAIIGFIRIIYVLVKYG